MADPVQSQGVGGGEGVPAAVADTPSVGALPETAVPEAQAADSSKEVSVPQHEEQNNQEAKVETQQAGPEAISDTQNGANVNVVTEGPDEVKVGPPVNATPQAEQSTVPEPSNNGEIKGVETVVIPEVSSNVQNGGEGGWQKRESELLKKIEELEKVKNARSEDGLRLELKVREEEIDLLKARVKNLEMELQVALSKPGGGKNHEMIENIKQQHEELLSKARGMIFDKTKMVKNQELQIEALTTQVSSLKDINQITKDLLEIRNSEVKAMEERFQAMEARYKAEKERYDLVLKRAQTSTNINDDLRKEYETQLAIFKELREKYELRVQALVAENNRLKESVKGPGTSQ